MWWRDSVRLSVVGVNFPVAPPQVVMPGKRVILIYLSGYKV